MNEVISAIQSLFPNAFMARQNKTNFLVVPTDEGFVKVATAIALAKDTKAHKAFNAEAAKAEYKAYVAETARKEAEKANKPVKEKGINVEAQARRDAIDTAIEGMPSFTDYTATDVMNALAGVIAENTTVMAVGSSAMRMVEKGILSVRKDEKGKKFYTKA